MLELNGEIQRGDLEQIRRDISQLPTHENKVFIYLNSTGGDPFEAMEIGRYFFKEGFRTFVRPNGECSSGCFLVLLGGYDNEEKRRYRVKPVNSLLGVHRSALRIGAGNYTAEQLGQTFDAQQLFLLEIVKYFQEMSVSLELLAMMFSSDKTYYINNSEAEKNGIKAEDCSNRFKEFFCEYYSGPAFDVVPSK